MGDNETPVTASGQGGESVLASEEPQEERGAPGSRDTGSGPAGGPVDRPTNTAEGRDSTGVNVDGSSTETDAPTMPAGDQGG